MSENITESDIFVLLAERRRRLAIEVLRQASSPISVETLADRIGHREYQNPSAEQLRTIYIALYHVHLPRLEDADVVRYDRDGGTVYPGRNFDALVRVLAETTDRDEPWSDD